MMIALPHGSMRDYLKVFGVAAVYVAEVDAGHCRIGATLDLAQTHSFISRRQMKIVRAFWVKDGKTARRVSIAARARLPMVDGVAGASAETAIEVIEAVALLLGVRLTDHRRAMARVTMALSRVDQALAEGSLGWFNGVYRAYRLASTGRTMRYGEARVRLRNAVVRRILAGQGLEGLQVELFGDLSTVKCTEHQKSA